METIKFAFDMIIVGTLALFWLGVVIDLFFPKRLGQMAHLVSFARDDVRWTIVGVLLFATAYFLGAVVSRLSSDFFNDGEIAMQDKIRLATYEAEPSTLSEILPKDDSFSSDRLKLFQLQESAILLEGNDKTERLRRIYEQGVVLRGAAFDGLILAVLCLFGWCATENGLRKGLSLGIGWVVAISLLLWAVYSSIKHFLRRSGFGDAPFLEVALFMLGFAGIGTLYSRGIPKRPWFTGFAVSLLLAIVAFFGWWWTEILYDQQVIYSFYAASRKLLNLAH